MFIRSHIVGVARLVSHHCGSIRIIVVTIAILIAILIAVFIEISLLCRQLYEAQETQQPESHAREPALHPRGRWRSDWGQLVNTAAVIAVYLTIMHRSSASIYRVLVIDQITG
jgi:hypothetical protein